MAVLLLLCLLDMPYGFYQLVRFIALVAFGLLAYDAHLKSNNFHFITSLALAVLFQPLLKISFGREFWNFIDIVVAAWLIFQAIILFKQSVKKA
jgi:hypothetical protein